VWVQTTQADFNTGTQVGTTVTNTAGGEVTLGAGGGGDWCVPGPNISTTFDLPKNGVANGISSKEGKIIAGTGDNSSGVSLADVNVSNANPPVVSQAATFDGYKTNDVYVNQTSGYAYIATDTNTKEIAIVQLNGATISEVGSFDASGSTDANSIFVLGTKGYMTQGNNFRIFDLTSHSGARSQLGSTSLAGTGESVYVVGNYAYVAVSSASTREMQIIDVSNAAAPSIVGYADLDSASGKDLYINSTGTRAYVVTNSSSTQKEFFIIDISTKSGSRPTVGSYEASGMSPKGVSVVPGNKALIVGTSGEEYQSINIATESNPVRCGGMQIDTGINGISSVLEADGDAYSYIITGDASAELKVILGGPGGHYAAAGTFTSRIFDAGVSTAFNRLDFTAVTPPGTTLTFQVAAADPVVGSCTGATYIFEGPDGTAATSFSAAGPIALDDNGSGYENPARCLRYKATFGTNDPSSSPVLSDVTVNYSP
jgi:hypothetical protein